MSITNAIQGLNQTVELLSKILANVEASNQQKNNNTEATEKRTAGGSKVTSLDGLASSLNVINSIDTKKSQTNAGNVASIFNNIFNKDFISNILLLVKNRKKIKMVKPIFESLVSSLNALENLKIDKDKADNFVKMINSVSSAAMSIPKLLYALAGVIVVAAAVGFLAVKAFPQIAIGLGLILGVGVLTAGLFMLLNKLSNKIGGNTSTDNNTDIKNKSLMNFGPIKNIGVFLVACGGMILLSALIGTLAKNHFGTIFGGMAILGVSMLLLTGVFKLMTIASNNATDALKSIIGITLILTASVGLVFLSAFVGGYVMDHWKPILSGFGMLTLIMIAMIGLVWLTSKINTTTILKGIVATVLLMVPLYLLVNVVKLMSNIAMEANSIGGINKIWEVAGIMGAVFGTMLLIVGGLSAIIASTGGIGAAVIGGATAIIATLAGSMLVIASSVKEMVNIAKIIKDNGLTADSLNFDIISKGIASMANAIGGAAIHAKNIKKMARPLYKMMKAVGKFVDIISKFGVDSSGKMHILEVDENGKTKLGPLVDIPGTATAIGNAVEMFTKIISEKFNTFDKEHRKKFNKGVKSMNKLFGSISSMVSIITETNKNISNADMESTAESISNAFSVFIDKLHSSFEQLSLKSGAAIKFLGGDIVELMSGISGFAEGIKSLNVKEIENAPARYKSISEIISSINSDFADALSKTYSPLEGDILKTQIGYLFSMFGETDNISKVDDNIDKIKTSVRQLNRHLKNNFDIVDKEIARFKEFTAAINDLVAATEKLEKTNLTINAKLSAQQETQNQNIQNTQNGDNNKSNNTESKVTVKDYTNGLSPAEFANAIKDALGGNTIKISFNDSREDILGQMSIL